MPQYATAIATACRTLGLPDAALRIADVEALVTARVPGVLLARCTPSQWVPIVADCGRKLGWLDDTAYFAAVQSSANVGCGRPMDWNAVS